MVSDSSLMKMTGKSSLRAASELRRIVFFLLTAFLAAAPAVNARADERPHAAAPTGSSLTNAALAAWAMHWFTEMMAGRTDRSQYSADFAPQVTDAVVARIAHDLNTYGAPPLRAEIARTKKDGDQTFAVVKFVFPRGDATSLLFGFDAAGKVTAFALGGLAGD